MRPAGGTASRWSYSWSVTPITSAPVRLASAAATGLRPRPTWRRRSGPQPLGRAELKIDAHWIFAAAFTRISSWRLAHGLNAMVIEVIWLVRFEIKFRGGGGSDAGVSRNWLLACPAPTRRRPIGDTGQAILARFLPPRMAGAKRCKQLGGASPGDWRQRPEKRNDRTLTTAFQKIFNCGRLKRLIARLSRCNNDAREPEIVRPRSSDRSASR